MNDNATNGELPFFSETWSEVAECLRHYYRTIYPNMPLETKKTLLERMKQYMEEHGLTDDNPIDYFPELKEYWGKDTLSQIELAVTANSLGHAIFKPYKI